VTDTMKLSKKNMDDNRDDMVFFAKNAGNVFYDKAVAEYETAKEVLNLAQAECDAAFHKLAMQIKLCDSEEYAKIGIEWSALEDLPGASKLKYVITNGKFRIGQTAIFEKDFRHRQY